MRKQNYKNLLTLDKVTQKLNLTSEEKKQYKLKWI